MEPVVAVVIVAVVGEDDVGEESHDLGEGETTGWTELKPAEPACQAC